MCGQRLRSHPKNFKKIRIAETPSIIYLSFLLFFMKQGWFGKGRQRRAQALEPRSVKTKRDNCGTRTKKMHICSLKMGSWLGDPAHTAGSCLETRSWTVRLHLHTFVALGHQKSAHLFAVKYNLHWETSSSDHCWIQSWDTNLVTSTISSKVELGQELAHWSLQKAVLARRSDTLICSTLGACCWERSRDTILGISIITSIICGTEASGGLQNAVLAGRTGSTSKICLTHETRGWILSLGPGHRNHFNRFQHCDVESLPNCPLAKSSRGWEIRHFDDLHSRLRRAVETGLEDNLGHLNDIFNHLRHCNIESMFTGTPTERERIMHHTARASAVQVAEPHWTVWWSRFQTAGTLAVGLYWKGRASELTPPTRAVGGAEAHWAVLMRRRRATWRTACAGWASRAWGNDRRDGLRDREAVVRAPATVTVRVTVTRGAQRRHGRGAATTEAKPGRRGRWRGGEPLSGVEGGSGWRVQGVEGVGRQLREPCGGPQFVEPRVGRWAREIKACVSYWSWGLFSRNEWGKNGEREHADPFLWRLWTSDAEVFREDHRKSMLVTQTPSQHCWMQEVRIAVLFSKSAVQTPCSEEVMKQLFSYAEGVCQSDGKTCVRILNWISGKATAEVIVCNRQHLPLKGTPYVLFQDEAKCSTCFSSAATIYQTEGHIHREWPSKSAGWNTIESPHFQRRTAKSWSIFAIDCMWFTLSSKERKRIAVKS